MGIDGHQFVEIRGPQEILDELTSTGLLFDTSDKECKMIGEAFFGKKDNIRRHGPRYLTYSFDYRNLPIEQYFEEMLNKYPMCWIKYTYSTEDGDCGMWIARFRDSKMSIQEFEWSELTMEELAFVDDFSK